MEGRSHELDAGATSRAYAFARNHEHVWNGGVLVADGFLFLFLWDFRAEHWLWLCLAVANYFYFYFIIYKQRNSAAVTRLPLLFNVIVIAVTWSNGAISHGSNVWGPESGPLVITVLGVANLVALPFGIKVN